MSKTILVTGGAASGKSRWAISYLSACNYVLYMASSDKIDRDTMNRIKYSTEQNYVQWNIETGVSSDPAEHVGIHKYVIFDNLASYTSKAIKRMCPDINDADDDMIKKISRSVIDDVTAMYDKNMVLDGNMIIITLETGFSSKPESKEQLVFREILGIVNQRIANMSNEVYLSASGIQFKIK
jgi:adenosylcobinamide kinase/adenosylcobinamide-phosphate guanylyltransferase